MKLDNFIAMQKFFINVAKKELSNKKKESHWMWFMFPQLKELGKSDLSHFFGLKDENEAKEYYANPTLKQNLNDLVDILLSYRKTVKLNDVFGELDAKKLCSCMTLFYVATKEDKFKQVIDKFYNGCFDEKTMLLLDEGK